MTTNPKANIMVIDDDLKSLMAMEALLAGPNRTIYKAESGPRALRYLLQENFALILLDVRMPEMDGFETAGLIRQREQSRYVPIIFLSAVDTLDADVLKGVSVGAVDYLFKPVIPEVLKSKVSVFVDLFQLNECVKRQALKESEETIRKLSTPVLLIRPGLLILPMIGMIDKQRFDQLQEQLLKKIRGTRARVVIMDVTGAEVEGQIIINRIINLVEAARLMGARVILTGMNDSFSDMVYSSEIKLNGFITAGDLQDGFEKAQQMLRE